MKAASRKMKMTIATRGATIAATGIDLQKKRKRLARSEMRMGAESHLLPFSGKTVGRTVWTVAVTGMDVCDPDIWIGEKVITAVVVVNEVTSRLDAVGVERSVVLETGLTAANWLRLDGLDQTR
jgi:hypothetical protein